MERINELIRDLDYWKERAISGMALGAELIGSYIAERDELRTHADRLAAALELAEDVLSRFPFSSEIWPNGMHPNAGIEAIRAALKTYKESKQ